MPFGLTNVPAVFQNLVSDVLGCLDDILIFSFSETEHLQHARAVLQHLLRNQLYVKAEKCEFHAATFLGFILSTGQLSMDPSKIDAVRNWATPENHK